MEAEMAERFYEELYSGGNIFIKVAVAAVSAAYIVAVSIILAKLVAAERNLPENQRTIIVRQGKLVIKYIRVSITYYFFAKFWLGSRRTSLIG